MRLLIIKSDSAYIRFKAGEHLRVKLDKASVYPPDQINTVREHVERLREIGFEKVHIKTLVITEEPFNSVKIGKRRTKKNETRS